ncbi:uncharacterized protein LOC111601635 [Drosophila hydei]|uniref:ascorbate ferrireductase (transmembrane) n=1 Tax=Drosophila hydei TaxID=7224 RepID=A0A6J1M6R4_DROHY|nr:uncharacterized protein LOC111601635 [Drosophila hydei]
MAIELVEPNETEVNATGEIVKSFEWPGLPADFFSTLIDIGANIIIILVIAVIARKCLKLKLARTAGHAFYFIVGVVICASEALILEQALLHMAFGLISVVIACLGVGAQIMYKQRKSRGTPRHFRSNHSIFGLAACILLLATCVTGMYMICRTNYWEPEVPIVHRVCGLLSFILLMTALVFAFNTGFMHCNWEQRSITCFKCWILLATFLTSTTQLLAIINDSIQLMPPSWMKHSQN